MKLHPLLNNPQAVLISQTSVSNPVSGDDYIRAAQQAMAAMQITLENENAVLKPNVTIGESFANPDSGVTTHPAFIQGMIEYLQDHGIRHKGAYILEDPRNTDDNETRHWKKTGFLEVASKTGAKLRTPKTYTCVKKTIPNPIIFPTLNVSRLAVAPNTVLINVPKLKTHNLNITTLCMKNLMGAVNVFDRHYCDQAWQAWQDAPETPKNNPRLRKVGVSQNVHERWQAELARRLIDTAKVLRPQINIIEGIIGRDGTGFNRGTNYTLGLAIAGINMVAVDSVASYLMGFDPQHLIYLRMAAEAGLGTNNLAQLHIYTVQDDIIVPCSDVETLRIKPPFRVISNITDDN